MNIKKNLIPEATDRVRNSLIHGKTINFAIVEIQVAIIGLRTTK